jgi:hypothetical protein
LVTEWGVLTVLLAGEGLEGASGWVEVGGG